MAWPLVRYQSLVAAVSVIGANLLNAIQDAIVGIYTGAASITWTVAQTFQAGLLGTGVTDGIGVHGIGGPASAGGGPGVYGWGSGGADGVTGAGGPTDGTGVHGIGGGTNGVGVLGYGKGAGAGGSFSNGLDSATPISSATPGAGQAVPLGRAYQDTLPVAWAAVHDDGRLTRGANILTCAHHATGLYWITLNHYPAVPCPVASSANPLYVTSAYWDDTNHQIIVHSVERDNGSDQDTAFNLVVYGGG
jgi:hypothetical protein